MRIKVLAVGKRHESWVAEGIKRYETRLRNNYQLQWQILAHSFRREQAAREEESAKILAKIKQQDFVILLDERGKIYDSPGFAKVLQRGVEGGKQVLFVIGGSYGVDDRVRDRANHVWSFSNLVFPHQLVRLMLVEQVYRAQEINLGGAYHHE